jgi:hypothetical protein
MHVERNFEARSCTHSCGGKAISITQTVCVFVALGIKHTMRMPAPLYSIFPHYLINGTILEKKVIEHKMCFDFLYNFCLKHFRSKCI